MNRFLYIIFAFFMVSCYTIDGPKKPDNLITEDKMVSIIVDMSLFNSAKGVNKRLVENQNLDLKTFIYEKHEIDSVQFAQSNTYYANRIEDYNTIYTRVKDSLSKLKDTYTAIDREEKKVKRKRDSIRRATQKDSLFKEKKGIKTNKENASQIPNASKRKVSKKPKQD